MHDYTQTAATAPRQRVTLDMLMAQISGLLDHAAQLANNAERNADELCGSTPETADNGPDGPRAGKLEQLSQMLDMVQMHQHRASAATRRVSNVVLNTDIEAKLVGASSGSILGTKVSY